MRPARPEWRRAGRGDVPMESIEIAEKLKPIAEKLGCSVAQLVWSLFFTHALYNHLLVVVEQFLQGFVRLYESFRTGPGNGGARSHHDRPAA